MIFDKLNKNCRKAIIELAYGDQEVSCPTLNKQIKVTNLDGETKEFTCKIEDRNMKYRKKPVTVEAIQLTRMFFSVAFDMIGKNNIEDYNTGEFKEDGCFISIKTLSGIMHAEENDWIIKGSDAKGGFQCWSVTPEYFAANYEEVKENGS